MTTLSCPRQTLAIYKPRRPEKTVLFEVVKKHYNTWCKNSQNPIPHYIDKVFRSYLECGILAKGFACAHCDSCKKDFLIGFSCKRRGLCPSCNTKNMVETAAYLCDTLIPLVPMRQWVVSFPMRIRHYLQINDYLQAVLKIVVDKIRKRLLICSPNRQNAQIGAVSFIQHFGAKLNYHPHFHILVADGVFNNEGELLFHEAFITQDE